MKIDLLKQQQRRQIKTAVTAKVQRGGGLGEGALKAHTRGKANLPGPGLCRLSLRAALPFLPAPRPAWSGWRERSLRLPKGSPGTAGGLSVSGDGHTTWGTPGRPPGETLLPSRRSCCVGRAGWKGTVCARGGCCRNVRSSSEGWEELPPSWAGSQEPFEGTTCLLVVFQNAVSLASAFLW